jgi:hypothetical protein
MQRKTFLKVSAVGLAVGLLPWLAHGDVFGIDKTALAALDTQVSTVVEGYNKGNWKTFYGAGWCDQTKSIQTEQTFNALYKNMAMKEYGTLKSRKINESRSTFSDVNGLIVYDAEFSKKKGILAVNFFKEGGKYKIQQVQMQP